MDKNRHIDSHFPYSIGFSGDGVSFDAGPTENALAAAQTVHEVITHNYHLGVTSMTPPQDLITRFILGILPEATQTTL